MSENKELNKIFVVEDDVDIQFIIEMALVEFGGFEVVICPDGKTLFDILQNSQPDLILLDVMLPDDDGPTIITKLKADPAYADIPVIFATARVRGKDVQSYMDLGAIGVLSKPYEIEELCDQIRDMFHRS
ncbi:response regulator [Thalassospira australica]|uniref:response regulator n=1 Tax=Thalassospira australica TaxID=1528106 RepID=UPI000519F736|nr:response regulator [Thalassospira australica]